MKKVIGGKTYNSETAQHLGSFWNGLSNSDFGNISENLYLSKKGQYFIAGEGGALTRYAVACGDMKSGGDAIYLCTEEEALEWAERHMGADEIEKHFTVDEG